MIQFSDLSKVMLPDSILKKQMDKDFVGAIKKYLEVGYPSYEFLYVQGTFAVCLMRKDWGGDGGQI